MQLAGAGHLLKVSNTSSSKPANLSVAYLQPDEDRDAAAKVVVEHNQISRIPELDRSKGLLTFSCYSSLALKVDSAPVQYTIFIELAGVARCTCPDFLNRGGACKHLRAAILVLEEVRAKGISIPLKGISY